jgi:flagellar protein FlgJ
MSNYVDLISGLALQARGLTSKGETADQLKQACREFEAIFVEQMMRSMKATVPEGGFINKSSATKMFEEMLDQQFAREIAASGQLGMGETLYRQMASVALSGTLPKNQSEDPKTAK